MEKFFHLKENGTTVSTEIVAGLTTFFAMSYIIVVNPQILHQTGMPWGGVFLATIIAAIIGTLVMGLFANVPYAQAAGMGLNAFFTYTVCFGLKFTWQETLCMVFLCGLINIIITVTKIRKMIIMAIPESLQHAIGGVIGLLLATIGIDGMGGVNRFTFGSVYLMGGISFIPLLIGLFAFSQGLNTIEEMAKGYKAEKNKLKIEHVFPSKSDLKRIFPTLIRSSIIGTFIGAVPGTGGDIASWVSYSQAKPWSKHKEEFGHGSPEGIAASESGNNAISGGAFVPLLSMGIPGDAGTAVMLGSLTMLGLAPARCCSPSIRTACICCSWVCSWRTF